MRLALDTNIVAYAEGVNDAAKKKSALDIIQKLPPEITFLPVQVIGELFHVLVREAGRTPERARAALLSWQDAFPLIEASPAIMLAAANLAVHHHFSTWDAVIFSAAAAAGCRLASLRRPTFRIYLERCHRHQSIFCLQT